MNESSMPEAHGRLTGLEVRKEFPEVHNETPCFLTQGQIRDWNSNGYILDLPLLRPSELEAARGFFSAVSGEEGPRRATFNTHARTAFGHELVKHAKTLGYLRDLIGAYIVCFISEYIDKPPLSPAKNYGHQDCVYNALDVGCPIVWLALEDADEGNGCMQFVPGSHKLGVLDCNENFDVEDISRYTEWVPARVQAGHCVIMSDLLIHNSPANPSPTRRRPAFTATYAPAGLPLLTEYTAEPILCCGVGAHPSWAIRPCPDDSSTPA